MKTLILPILLLVTFATTAQKPIKITTEIDDFTGDTTIRTSFIKFQEPLGGDIGMMFTGIYTNGAYYIGVLAYVRELTTSYAGDQMSIRLTDGTIINLLSTSTETAGYIRPGTYNLITVYSISVDDLVKLTTTPIEKVRIQTSSGNIDRDPSPKKAPAEVMASFAEFYRAVVK
jgi:hypothetical protein